MIGISGPSSSTSALVTPQPASAAITCSTVETVTPSRLRSTVQRRVSDTRSQRAWTIASRPVTSRRLNQMP